MLVLITTLCTAAVQAEPVKVVASTTDLAAVAREVGGEWVTVTALCRADQDPHGFEILPAQLAEVKQADLFLKVGAGLDIWADRVTASAGSDGLVVVSCDQGVPLIHDAGRTHDDHDAHPRGNPHYWLGPTNLKIVAATIRDGLIRVNPAHADAYEHNTEWFAARIDSALNIWQARLTACADAALVSAHPSWDYFARDFHLVIAGTVNPAPGAEPSPLDLAKLEAKIRGYRIAIFLREPFTSERMPAVLAKDTGIRVMLAPPSVGATPATTDVWSLFDYLTMELSRQCRDGK